MTSYHAKVFIYDPWIDPVAVKHEHKVTPHTIIPRPMPSVQSSAVAHPEFLQMGADGIHAFAKKGRLLHDVKSMLSKADGRL